MTNKKGPFSSKNYRLYFAGQAISLIGTWVQQVALAWLVFTLSGSGTVLGFAIAAQTLPILILGPYGGLLADRFDKRRLLMVTQVLLGLVSLLVGSLVITKAIEIWMVFALCLAIGLLNCAANPARQSFISELVDSSDLRSAVSLGSVLVNTARAIGPAIAGLLIATVGIELCFFIDAVSYIAVIVALAAMNSAELHSSTPVQRGKGQIREGLRYVRNAPPLLIPLLMMILIGTFAYEFQVLLPLVAAHVFDGDAGTLGALLSAQGLGAIAGGLYVAKHGSTGIKAVTRGAALFGVAMALAAFAPTFHIEMLLLFLVGATSVQFLSVGNSTLQLNAEPAYRGRVMALWSMAFLGSTPIGGPLVGWIAEHLSPRLGLGIGALSCLVATIIGLLALRNAAKSENSVSDGENPAYTENALRV
jgi:MFS family permease